MRTGDFLSAEFLEGIAFLNGITADLAKFANVLQQVSELPRCCTCGGVRPRYQWNRCRTCKDAHLIAKWSAQDKVFDGGWKAKTQRRLKDEHFERRLREE